MIEAKHLIKDYKSKSGVTTKALNDISLKLPKKGMVFILGKSGSGKSTLLNVLGGLDRVDSGEIIIKGKSSAEFKQSHFDSYRNTYVGFIFQEYNILDDFTVGQNIALAMKLQNRKPSSEDINNILTQVDLAGLGDRKPNELSGGQKQRVAIARALIKNPQIIMADEPTGALDSATGIQIFDALKKLSKDKLVLIVSHDREFSERYADRIIELKDGKIISDVENTSKKSAAMEGITCAGNEVIVRQNYELTSKDLKIINAFLKKNKKDIKIKTGTGSLSKSSFTETKEKNIEMDTSGFSLIKSKLPLSHAFKMGTSALKHKKFKLVMTIFLSLVSFTMLGMSATMGFYNPVDAHVDALRKAPFNFTYWNKRLQEKEEYNYLTGVFTDDEIDLIKNKTGNDLIPVYSENFYREKEERKTYYATGFNNNLPDEYSKYTYPTNFGGAVNLTENTIEKYSIESIGNGSLPQDEYHIAIPYFIAYTFKVSGYCEYKYIEGQWEKQNPQTIEKVEQLIGKTICLQKMIPDEHGGYTSENKLFTISGIYDTKFDFLDKKYEQYFNGGGISGDEGNELYFYRSNSLADKVIVNNTLVKQFGEPCQAIGYLPSDKASIKKICNLSTQKFAVSEEDKEIAPRPYALDIC